MAEVKYLSYEGLQRYHNKITNYIDNQDAKYSVSSPNETITVTEGDADTQTKTQLEVNIDGETIIQDTTSKKLKVASSALVQYQGENAINISAVDNTTNTKTVSLTVDSTDLYLENTSNGLKADISIAQFDGDAINSLFGSDAANIAKAYALVDKNGNPVTGTNGNQVITIPKDSALLDVKLSYATTSAKPTYSTASGEWTEIAQALRVEENLALCFAYRLQDGNVRVEVVPVGNFLRESEFADGLQVQNGIVKVVVDPQSESNLTVTSNGIKLTGLNNGLAAARTTLTEKAAVTTVPSTGAPNIIVTKTVDSTDEHYNYSITGQDLASATLLTAEVTRATRQEDTIEAAVGLNASGQHVTTAGNYTSSATTIAGEIDALDIALKGVRDDLDDITAISNSEIDGLFA